MNRAHKKSTVAPKQQPKVAKKATKKPLKQQKRRITNKKSLAATTTASAAFRQTAPVRGLWDTPQDEPGSKPEPYVDFFKDTPVNSLAGQLVRDMRDFFLVQTGSPQYFDRDYEQQKLLGMEQFNAHKQQLRNNNYAGYRGHAELAFNNSYYTRVDMKPSNNIKEPVLNMNPKWSAFRQTVPHWTISAQTEDPIYLDHRDHVAMATGLVNAGPYFVPRTKFQFPVMSIDNDYLFFHD